MAVMDRDAERQEEPRTSIKVKAAFIGTRESGWHGATVVSTWPTFVRRYGSGGDLGPSVKGWFDNGGGPCVVAPLDGNLSVDPLERLRGDDNSGLVAVAKHHDVDVVACPGLLALAQQDDGQVDLELWNTLQLQLINACHLAGDRIALLDPPPGMTAATCKEWRISFARFSSAYAALYFPWIMVMEGSAVRRVPPCGHIAGLFAASASGGSLARAPANVRLAGVVDVDYRLSMHEVDLLYPSGINPLIVRSRWGVRPWGARTLSDDSELRDLTLVRVVCRIAHELAEPLSLESTSKTVSSPADVQASVLADLRSVWERLTAGRPCPVIDAAVSSNSIVLRLRVGDFPEEWGNWAVYTWDESERWSPELRVLER
jgi:hypothetical protein